jgi:hypothetical protein
MSRHVVLKPATGYGIRLETASVVILRTTYQIDVVKVLTA